MEVDSKKWREDLRKARRERYLEESKRRLVNIIKKHVTTTFIGALASFEEVFGNLWGHDATNKTSEQEEMHELYLQARNSILNKGNHELRAIQDELEQYEVDWKRYQATFIMVDPNTIKQGEKG